eukprot:7844478-Alexandrium_andersonii.AAC.2
MQWNIGRRGVSLPESCHFHPLAGRPKDVQQIFIETPKKKQAGATLSHACSGWSARSEHGRHMSKSAPPPMLS